LTLSGVLYIVRSGKLTCTCRKSALTTTPCDHERDVARARKIPIHEIFEEKDTVSTWKKQYSVVNLDSLVSVNEVFSECIGPHKLPVVFKKPKGRPKAQNRKKSQLEIATAKYMKKNSIAV